MRIGIDIDGVLTDIEQWQLDYGSKFFCENDNKKIINSKGFEIHDIFNCSLEVEDALWNQYFNQYFVEIKARRFASEIIKKLKKAGYEIYIITARGNSLSNSAKFRTKEFIESITKEWLKSNDIYYDRIFFTPEDKLNVCINNNISIMIEDKVDNINKISTKLPVICFNAGYNEICEGEKIYRVYSWYDIYNIIKSIKQN